MKSRPRALIIESDEHMRSILEVAFKQKGWATEAVSLPKDCLWQIIRTSFDLIILNQGRQARPDIGGSEFSHTLKKLHPKTPIIIIWGHIKPTKHAADDVIQKPFQLSALNEVVDRLVSDRRRKG